MLRTIGIPARIVTGFYGGEFNEYGGYVIVRQSNAHSWVEAAIDGGWRLFDPTPSVVEKRASAIGYLLDMLRMKWNRYVVAFSASDQKEIITTLSTPFRLPSLPAMRLPRVEGLVYAAAFMMTGLVALLPPEKNSIQTRGICNGPVCQTEEHHENERGAYHSLFYAVRGHEGRNAFGYGQKDQGIHNDV